MCSVGFGKIVKNQCAATHKQTQRHTIFREHKHSSLFAHTTTTHHYFHSNLALTISTAEAGRVRRARHKKICEFSNFELETAIGVKSKCRLSPTYTHMQILHIFLSLRCWLFSRARFHCKFILAHIE